MTVLEDSSIDSEGEIRKLRIPEKFASAEEVVGFVGEVSSRISGALAIINSKPFSQRTLLDMNEYKKQDVKIIIYLEELCKLSNSNIAEVLNLEMLAFLRQHVDFFDSEIKKIGLLGTTPILFGKGSIDGDPHTVEELFEEFKKLQGTQ